MSFYSDKVRAMQDIRETIANNSDNDFNTNISALALKITNKYGFSEKFTLNYLNQIVKVGNYELKGNNKGEIAEIRRK